MANDSHGKWGAVTDAARKRFAIPQEIDPPHFRNVIEMVESAARRYPGHPAFSCLGHTLSFAEVDALSSAFAAYLTQHCQLQAGDRIAIQLPNILQYPVAVYGALKAGLVVVNTNPLYTVPEMAHQFNDSGAVAIVVLANMANKVQEVLPGTGIRHVLITEMADLHPAPKRHWLNFAVKYLKKMVPDYFLPQAKNFRQALQQGKRLLQQQPQWAAHRAESTEVAVLQYTGGTTGIAKGAMLTHGNLLANMLQVYPLLKMAGITEGQDVFVAPLPLYHIYAFMLHGMTAFSWGCHSILVPNPRNIPDLVKILQGSRFNVMVGLNTLFIALLNHSSFRDINFGTLKITLSGGMALSVSVAEQWQKITACVVVEGYGLTETSPVVSLNPPGHVQIGTIGLPLPATYVRVINEQGEDCGEGEAGELCVRGPQVMLGYWQRSQATDEVLQDGWLRTGDIALIQPDGFVRIVDRKKDLIIVSGFNVYPNEVENVVNAHPDVLESAAVGVANEHSGEVVKLFVVRKSETLTESILKAWCVENLAAYKCPKYIEFRQELPKSNVGKILRRELRG